jgi:hypothetical protein
MVSMRLAVMAVLAAVAVTVSAQGQAFTGLPTCAVSWNPLLLPPRATESNSLAVYRNAITHLQI